jgi:hypothetical protein
LYRKIKIFFKDYNTKKVVDLELAFKVIYVVILINIFGIMDDLIDYSNFPKKQDLVSMIQFIALRHPFTYGAGLFLIQNLSEVFEKLELAHHKDDPLNVEKNKKLFFHMKCVLTAYKLTIGKTIV